MTRRGVALLRQLGGFALLAGLAFSLCGDRTSAAGVPATIYGQDPLEVLELKVRPNVVLVFDSSSSMQGALKANLEFEAGDHPRTRNHQGKKAISDVVKANQSIVSFQFGTYTAYEPEFGRGETSSRYFGKPGFLRWQYMLDGRNISCPAASTAQSQSCASSSFMTTASTELSVQGAVGDTLGRGLQSWQIIQSDWSRLYFGEGNGAVCYATIAAPRFFGKGADLAAALTTAMNAPTCTTGTALNKYTVRYTAATGVFTFDRNLGFPNSFQIRWADKATDPVPSPFNIAGALGKRGAANTPLGTTTVSSGAPYTLLYRNKIVPTLNCGNNPSAAGCGPAPFLDGMPIFYQFQEAIPVGSSTIVKFHQLGAGRLWNGETIRVTPTGEACGMDFATPLGPGVKTNPGSLVLQAADASCNATGNTARFEFAGGHFRGENDQGLGGCGGFRSRSDLVPCDLVSPPAPMQFQQIGPLLENELPLESDPASANFGNPKDFTTNDATGVPGQPNYLVPDGKPDYLEDVDGSWATSQGLPTQALLQGTVKIRSGTPIANSLIDIKGTANPNDTTCVTSVDPRTDSPVVGPCPERGFTKLWNTGQAGTTNMAGPPPWQLDPIKDHGACPPDKPTCEGWERKPKEKTIVLFVTDGGDSCSASQNETRRPPNSGNPSFPGTVVGVNDTFGDNNQRRAAYYAAELYRPLDTRDTASSVTTYIIGYGGGVTGLDWIAWGGSGLGQGYTGQAAVDFWQSTSDANLKIARSQCTTCVDAFIAPDAETLEAQLQALIDRGASEGEFNAQQSITESVFEYVDRVGPGFDASIPTRRYNGIVPTRFLSSFTLPGFRGHLSAYQSDGATTPSSVLKWDAGKELMEGFDGPYPLGPDPGQVMDLTNPAFTPGTCSTQGGADPSGLECSFDELHGGATTDQEVMSKARIKRRIYTTRRNGVYTFDPEVLMAGTSTERLSLWPPLYMSDATALAAIDTAMGLPPDAPTTYPPGTCASPSTAAQCWVKWLQDQLGACTGSNMPSGCTSTTTATKMQAVRAEAREITLAFLAGATTVPIDTGGIKRASTGPNSKRILYRKRDWVLADGELATAAVVTPPSLNEPKATPYLAEYKLYLEGTRSGGKNIDGGQIRQGFGLTKPDDDGTVADGQVDTRDSVKPVMTVVYAPANDGLHAFRAGPCGTQARPTPTTGCSDTGGEELWSFVPYDQLHTLLLRAAYEPQGRADHVYSLARGVRFADVFVPKAMTNKTIGGVSVASMQGAWRRILYFGRGIGGKYVTALDVTAPGTYTTSALSTVPPIPLWSRGNPDTQNGQPTGPSNNDIDTFDYKSYRHMGETWSMPTVAYVQPAVSYKTSRRDNIDFVLFMGSGYGNPATYADPETREGTTHYTLDALTGDVIFTADVDERTGEAYPNAIVANSVSFNRSPFAGQASNSLVSGPHPWSKATVRVYVGDIHGRLWKFLVDAPDQKIPAADFGAGQPIGTAVALLGEPQPPGSTDENSTIPNIFVTTGADRRAAGPFVNASLIDEGDDVSTTWTGPNDQTTGPPDGATVTYFPPVRAQFARYFAEGTPEGSCAADMPKAVFRGTIQPTSAVECSGTVTGGTCEGTILHRVFFGGTRLSLPATLFAPPTPIACGTGLYPCRSQFDTILYALGVETGLAAYELNPTGSDQAYRIFRDSRIAAISFQADPDPNRQGSRFATDEGLIKGAPKPPPPPGVPPMTTSAGSSVTLWRDSGQPAPAVQYGSTVCQ